MDWYRIVVEMQTESRDARIRLLNLDKTQKEAKHVADAIAKKRSSSSKARGSAFPSLAEMTDDMGEEAGRHWESHKLKALHVLSRIVKSLFGVGNERSRRTRL